MSLKVIHTKADGTQVPIKVSIWDAFKGVPNRKPRQLVPTNCRCCGKIHCLGKKPDDKDEPKDGEKTNDNEKRKDSGKTEDDKDLNPDDHIILRMKAENPSASWADIHAATSSFRHPGDVKARFKEIKHHLDQGGEKQDNTPGKKGKNGKHKAKNADKEEIAKQHKEEGLKRKAEEEAKKEEEKKAEEKKVEEEKAKEEAAKKDDGGKKLTKARKEYDKTKGIALAAKHFDKTGVRITPKEALKMAEGK